MNWSEEKYITRGGHLMVKVGEYTWKMYHIGGKPYDWIEELVKAGK